MLRLKSLRLIFIVPIFLAISCASESQFSDKSGSYSKKTYKFGKAEEILAQMTTEEKVAQLFIIAPDSLDAKTVTSASENFKNRLAEYPVGGFIFFARNISRPEQIKDFISSIKKASPLPPIFSVDEEGGRIARLAHSENFYLPNFKSMESIGETASPENARGAGQIIGSYLTTFGFNMDFAPVADINSNPENIVIGDRSFGSDALLVSEMVGAFLSGLHSTGIKGCLKHFPGHGDTKGDTHSDYVAITKTWEELKSMELIPFVENIENADSIMVAHVTFTSIDPAYPASLSKNLISQKLRGELGYKGLILTDALNMGAIEKNYARGEAAVLAFEAGNDILLLPKDFFAAYNALLKAVRSNRISMDRLDESVIRILRLKGL